MAYTKEQEQHLMDLLKADASKRQPVLDLQPLDQVPLDLQPIETPSPPQSNLSRVEGNIASRQSLIPAAMASTASQFIPNPRQTATDMLFPALGLMRPGQQAALQQQALLEGYESPLANASLAFQRGQPAQALPDAIRGVTGQRSAKFGDVYQVAGVPTPIAASLGLALIPGGADLQVGLAKAAWEAPGALMRGLTNIGRPPLATVEDVLKTPEAKLPNLSATQRQIYFSERGQQIKTQFATQLDALNQEKLALQKQLGKTAQARSLELRPQLTPLFSRQSSLYRSMVDAELAPVANDPVPLRELASFVRQRFANDPNGMAEVSSRLGLTNELLAQKPTVQTDLGNVASAYSEQEPVRRMGELYKQALDFGQSLPRAVREGARVYGPSEHYVDDTISTLVDFLDQNGVDLKNARLFWKSWAPIRNQAVREFRPFNAAETQTASGSKRLIQLAKGIDPDNEVYAKTLGDLLGVKDLTGDVRKVAAQLDSNQKAALAMQVAQKEATGELAALRNQISLIVDRNARHLAALKWVMSLVAGGGAIIGGTTAFKNATR